MNKNIKQLVEDYYTSVAFNPAALDNGPKSKISTAVVNDMLSDRPQTKEQLQAIIKKKVKETVNTHKRGGETLDLSYIDTSAITDMSGLFKGMFPKNKFYIRRIDFTGWDTSNVTDMKEMFLNCKELQWLDLSMFDTRKVTDMSKMFYNCEKLWELDVSSFDTSNVETMKKMFMKCAMLRVDVSHFKLKRDVNLEYMFAGEDMNAGVKIFKNDKIKFPSGKEYLTTYEYDHMFKGWKVDDLPNNPEAEWIHKFFMTIIT